MNLVTCMVNSEVTAQGLLPQKCNLPLRRLNKFEKYLAQSGSEQPKLLTTAAKSPSGRMKVCFTQKPAQRFGAASKFVLGRQTSTTSPRDIIIISHSVLLSSLNSWPTRSLMLSVLSGGRRPSKGSAAFPKSLSRLSVHSHARIVQRAVQTGVFAASPVASFLLAS